MQKPYALFILTALTSISLSACVQVPVEEPVTATTTPVASQTNSTAKVAEKNPAPVGVKTIKGEPTYKAGQKLTPQEVEDLIRKLSVCRPS